MARCPMRLTASASLAALLPLAAAAQTTAAGARPVRVAHSVPRLIVFITVDQFRGDYFTRFGSQLTGGLARLAHDGALFVHGRQDHAITETAPGHAATMSGRFPRSTGIVRNSAGVYDPQAPLIGGGGDPASPFRFRGSVLVDWLRTADPLTRALSVSRKDRGAILPLGRAKQQVYWWADTGRFTTSRYYADTLPMWVRDFNAQRGAQRYAGATWDLVCQRCVYPEPDSVEAESEGHDYTFPHRFPADSTTAARQFAQFPPMDSLTLAFALAGARTLGLGNGAHTDLLAVSLSTTDAIGHRFGPDSRELHDQVLRLDRYLGAFLDSLYVGRDPTSVAIALTSDHGVAPLPELRAAATHSAAQRVDLTTAVSAARRHLAAAGVAPSALTFEDGLLLVDRPRFAGTHLSPDSVVTALAVAIRATSGVLRVDRPATLAGRDTLHDAIARRWFHQLPRDLPAALVVTLRPYNVWGGGRRIAEHGSPHDYDAEVPVVFAGPWFKAGRYEDVVRVVDMAPTLAAVAGVVPTERLDGHALTAILR